MNEEEVERLVASYPSIDLEEAENAIIQGKDVKISVAGSTPGQKLAYIAAALWIVEKIKSDDSDFRTAYEAYMDEIRQQ